MLKNQKTSKRKYAIIAAVLTGIAVVAFGVAYFSGVFDSSQSTKEEEAKTTSTAATAQDDFTGGDDRTPNQTTSNEGTLTDNNGSVSSTPPQSSWTVSPDNKITVFSPSKNTLIASGQEISGQSTYQKVNFRLIDDASGVIAEGNIAVVNGLFSGKLNFSSAGTNGRLDLFYSTNVSPESSNVEIPVRFK